MSLVKLAQEIRAGDIDVAIVGSCTDMNVVHGTMWAANMLRGFIPSSATYYQAKGDGKQTRERNVFPIDQYVRSSIHEINIVDYGNIKRHPYSGEKSTEEVRAVLGDDIVRIDDIAEGFAHLSAVYSCQSRNLGEKDLGLREGVSVETVESPCNLTRQLGEAAGVVRPGKDRGEP